MRRRVLGAIVLAIVAVSLAGASCDGVGADLVPERRAGSEGAEGYCRRDDSGNLVVRVRNQANPDAIQQSTTIVDFGSYGVRSVTTPAIAGGSFADVSVEIPSGCFDADCEFSITVDANDEIIERDEGNNTADGRCIG